MNTEEIYISSSVNLQQSESTASQVQSLQSFLSAECRAAALPFLCLYLIPLCDDSNVTYFPSMAECTAISTEVCKSEWVSAKQLVTNLPDCSKLSNTAPCNSTLLHACLHNHPVCILLFRIYHSCIKLNHTTSDHGE